MQLMLNKMVTSVRQGMLSPEDASRTVHECAVLLNMDVSNELPLVTLILTGLRKTVKANDVIRAFRRFGPIDDAAVASNERGFGKCCIVVCSLEQGCHVLADDDFASIAQ